MNIVSFRVKLRVEISSSRTLSDSSGSLSSEGVSGNGGMRDQTVWYMVSAPTGVVG